ncbi:MAG: hypothetical protein HYS27_02410 [Deltaproteobacteria bacterium]|nr:hypothetical protein [Deltaproteobacteria bacterium]
MDAQETPTPTPTIQNESCNASETERVTTVFHVGDLDQTRTVYSALVAALQANKRSWVAQVKTLRSVKAGQVAWFSEGYLRGSERILALRDETKQLLDIAGVTVHLPVIPRAKRAKDMAVLLRAVTEVVVAIRPLEFVVAEAGGLPPAVARSVLEDFVEEVEGFRGPAAAIPAAELTAEEQGVLADLVNDSGTTSRADDEVIP